MHDFNDIKMSTSSLIDQTPKVKSIEWHKKFKIKYDKLFVHVIIVYKKIFIDIFYINQRVYEHIFVFYQKTLYKFLKTWYSNKA